MRVIAGKYRGKKLVEFNLPSTRPTLDRVKESIFNLIQFDIDGATVLDLFSGTGAFGIETISRGAASVVLVDNNPEAIKIIKQNLKTITGNYEVKNVDALDYLKNCKTKFDLILLDPPYKTDLGTTAINLIVKNNLLKDNGIIIFETDKNHEFNFNNPNFEQTKKTYGTVAVYKLVKLN